MMNYQPGNNKFLLFLVAWFSLASTINAEEAVVTFKSEGMELKVEKIIDGLGVPWGMDFISENKLLVTERSGSVLLINLDSNKKITLKNVPEVMPDGQGGMLDIILSPRSEEAHV